MKREGIVVGGPWAGRWLSGDGPTHQCAELMGFVPARLSHQPDELGINRTAYVWREPLGIGLWMPADWDIETVIQELLQGYRPMAFKR